MHWAPVHSRQSGRWTPEWVCMRCNSTVDENHPLLQGVPAAPVCSTHGPRRLALDLREFSRGWVCCRGSPPEVLPCPGQRILLPESAVVAANPASHEPLAPTTSANHGAAPPNAAWSRQGPPDTMASGRTHSWLFVLCCMPRSVAFTPMRLMLGKPMLIMHRCGNAPLTFFARPRLCSPLLWCTRCIPCST